jgi:hypothetical protein
LAGGPPEEAATPDPNAGAPKAGHPMTDEQIRATDMALVDTGAAEPYRPRHAHAPLLLLSTPGVTDLGA